VRELKASGNLQDILLKKEEEQTPEEKCNLNDFELLAVLGRGGFGKVMQVRKRDTGRIYAMKVLHKSNIIKRNQVEHTRTERNVLGRLVHPFIVGLNYSFQTSEKLYFVLDCADRARRRAARVRAPARAPYPSPPPRAPLRSPRPPRPRRPPSPPGSRSLSPAEAGKAPATQVKASLPLPKSPTKP
jgi:hypothetical protein